MSPPAPAASGGRPGGRPRSYGMTLVEVIVGLAVLGTLAVVLAYLFRVTLFSSQRASFQFNLLTNARKALAGEGAYSGMLLSSQGSFLVNQLSTATLSVKDSAGITTAFTLNASGDLRETLGAATRTRAKGLTDLSVTYYARGPDYRIYEATAPATARLVAVTFQMSRPGRTVRFFSGGTLRNHE